MNKLPIILLISFLLPFSILAQDTHKAGIGFNYHLDQENGTGYQLFYQWQFAESFEFESRYIINSDIKLQSNEADIFANYDQFSIGANFIKRYNNELSIKAGTGLGFITTSSNESVIEKQTMAPYLMFAASYKFTNDFSIEFGQFTHFNRDMLQTNHSIFLSVSYQFGQSLKNYSPTEQASPPSLKPTNSEDTPEIKPSVTTYIAQKPVPNEPTNSPINKPRWYVQFGAFMNETNGLKTLNQLQKTYPDLALRLVKNKNYYRILTTHFISKQRAEDHVSSLKSDYNLSGYVTQLLINE